MSITEDRPRPDLSALRIHREDDDARRLSWGTIVGWIIAIAIERAKSLLSLAMMRFL